MKISIPEKKIFRRSDSVTTIVIISCLLLLITGSIFEIAAQEAKTDDFPVPPTYKLEGVPAIKKSDVEHLIYDPSAIKSNLIWETDGKNNRLLVTDETNNIHLLSTPLSPPVKLIEKVVPYIVKMRPGGESFAYTSDHQDEDNYRLYLYDFKDKSIKDLIPLTGKDESIDSFVWNKTGNALIFTRVDYDTKISKLCQFNFLTENCFQVDLRGIWNVLDTYENKILLKYWKASSSQLLYVFDTQTNKLTPVDEKGNSRKAFLVNNRVFWTSDGNDSCKSEPCMLSMNLKNNQFNQLKLPENLSDINDVKISPDGGNLLIQETKEGIDYLRIFNLKNDKLLKEIPQFITGSYVIWNTRWISENEVAYTLETIGKPASIQSYDIKAKKYQNWTKERLPQQLEGKVKPPEIIKWKSFDQKEISGFVVRPAAQIRKKSPVLIYVHGGPQMVDKPIFNSQDIRFASSLGLATIHTNIRGSSGFGKEFMDADNREKRGDAVRDIQSLLDWIEKQPDLDANQIYLRGGSYGGFIVLSTALQDPARIKGVIAEYPLISIRSYLSQSWVDEFTKTEYGDPGDEKLMAYLDTLSPLNNAEKWKNIPLFLTRGKLDSRTPEKDTIDLKNQLQGKGSEVWFIYSTDSGHGFGGPYMTAAMYMFLKKQINEEK